MSSSRLRNPESSEFAARSGARQQRLELLEWPVNVALISRVGDTVTRDRNGHGRPHEGVDLFVPAGTQVVSSAPGIVHAVQDGRFSAHSRLRRAGLFVDVHGHDARVYRYLHLGDVKVGVGMAIGRGDVIGSVAPAHTSGLGDTPHLHFEIRHQAPRGETYGSPINPLTLLPKRRS